MFSTEYYYLVAGLREWTLDSDTKGFDVREILDEIFEELTTEDRKAVELLYAYYDCENLIALRAKSNRLNQLGNLSAEQLDEVLVERRYSLLPKRVAEVVKLYVEASDEDRDEDIKLDERFERAIFEAYYAELADSKLARRISERSRSVEDRSYKGIIHIVEEKLRCFYLDVVIIIVVFSAARQIIKVFLGVLCL